jgi:hypothetical protein
MSRGFSKPTKFEIILLVAFEEGILLLPYHAVRNFMTSSQTRTTLESLEKRGWVVNASPYRLTDRGKEARSRYVNSNNRRRR